MVDQKQRFTEIFNKNLFRVGVPNLPLDGSISGGGSDLTISTEVIRKILPKLLEKLNIKKMLDAPCGDFNWMKEVDLSSIEYVGVDIVEQIIDNNQKKYTKSNIKFMNRNIIEDVLPTVDLIFCRDCLVHLSYSDIFKVLNNFKKSQSTYLLSTTFPYYEYNNKELDYKEIWRALNLEKAPFSFSKASQYIIEEINYNTPFHEKALGLWCLNQLQFKEKN